MKLIISFLFIFNAIYSDWSPKPIQSLGEVASFLKGCDQNALVVFDVDNVLIGTKDHFFRPGGTEVFLPLVDKAMTDASSDQEREFLLSRLSLLMIQPEYILFEEISPNLIRLLQDRGVKVIALTSSPRGKCGIVESCEKWRIDHLKSFGIRFTKAFGEIPPIHLTEIQRREYAPLFQEGILFSDGYSKGEVLKAFLTRVNFNPSEVIFIDDMYKNLLSVKEHLTIAVTGFHYLGADIPKDQINKDHIKLQFDHLIKSGQWLTDKEVHECLLIQK